MTATCTDHKISSHFYIQNQVITVFRISNYLFQPNTVLIDSKFSNLLPFVETYSPPAINEVNILINFVVLVTKWTAFESKFPLQSCQGQAVTTRQGQLKTPQQTNTFYVALPLYIHFFKQNVFFFNGIIFYTHSVARSFRDYWTANKNYLRFSWYYVPSERKQPLFICINCHKDTTGLML